MVESPALLVDSIFPHQPIRQWVLSVPFPLRWLFANVDKRRRIFTLQEVLEAAHLPMIALSVSIRKHCQPLLEKIAEKIAKDIGSVPDEFKRMLSEFKPRIAAERIVTLSLIQIGDSFSKPINTNESTSGFSARP